MHNKNISHETQAIVIPIDDVLLLSVEVEQHKYNDHVKIKQTTLKMHST